jgi:hypothetical protein
LIRVNPFDRQWPAAGGVGLALGACAAIDCIADALRR